MGNYNGYILKNFSYGFTLIEILLASLILALIMGVTYSSLSYIVKTKNLLDDNRDCSAIGNSLLNRLTKEFQLAFADPRKSIIFEEDDNSSSSAKNTANATFIGKSLVSQTSDKYRHDTVYFLAAEGGQYLPDAQQHSGVVQISYKIVPNVDRVTQDSQDYCLVREEIPHIMPPKEAYKRKLIFPLACNIVSWQLSYYNSKSKNWVQDWGYEIDQPKLPSMIFFNLMLKSKAGKIHEYKTAIYLRASQERIY